MDIFVLAAVAILAVMAGFWAGRSVRWQMADDGAEDEEAGIRTGGNPESNLPPDRKKNDNKKRIAFGQVIGSPVSGAMTGSQEEGKAVVTIRPEQGRIYAPAAGKITRLYPMGRAMQFQTEFGAELFIQAGSNVDEMQSDLYRCRIMEHEVVPKGKLLLEYDVEGLRAEGAGTEVTMSVENEGADQVAIAPNRRVRPGEEVMWVQNEAAVNFDTYHNR